MGAIIKHINRIIFNDYLIKTKKTGNLQTLAKKNGVSKSTMSDIIVEMKSLGFPIRYDRQRNTYQYEEEGEMIKSLFMKYGEVLNRNEMQCIGSTEDICFSERAIFKLCKNL